MKTRATCSSRTKSGSLAELPQGATLGTASLRRQAIALRLRPDLKVTPLRGNVETRLRKLEDGQVDATILALAGLKRLGLVQHATKIMDATEFLPAVGQGAIGIETRADNTRVRDMLAKIDHADTSTAVACERAFLAELDGSCKTPIGGHATLSGGVLHFRGLIVKPDGSAAHETSVAGPRDSANDHRRRCRPRLEAICRPRVLRLNARRHHPPAARRRTHRRGAGRARP